MAVKFTDLKDLFWWAMNLLFISLKMIQPPPPLLKKPIAKLNYTFFLPYTLISKGDSDYASMGFLN